MTARRAYGYILPDNGVAAPQLRRFRGITPEQKLVDVVREMLGNDSHEEIHVEGLGQVPINPSIDKYLPDCSLSNATYVVAVHNTFLATPFYLDDSEGTRILPSLGGNRISPYASLGNRQTTIDKEDLSSGVTAIRDAKELSRGMTYKWAALNLMMIRRSLSGDQPTEAELIATRMGGGKSVNFIEGLDALVSDNPSLIGDICPIGERTPDQLTVFEQALHRANARIVNRLRGRYIFAPDMNTDNAVMEYVRSELVRIGSPVLPVVCLSEQVGGSGDPSIVTAEGVYYGIRGLAEYKWGKEKLDGKTIGIQGVGKVGYVVLKRILEDYPKIKMIYLADISENALLEAEDLLHLYNKSAGRHYKTFHIKNDSDGEEFYELPMDIFSPNAKGQILTLEHVQMLDNGGCQVIAGGANNQRHPQEKSEVDTFMVENEIAYAPDYVINMGGVLNVIYERDDVKSSLGGGFIPERPIHVIRGLKSLLGDIVAAANEQKVPSQYVADTLVEAHLARYAMALHYSADDLFNRKYLEI